MDTPEAAALIVFLTVHGQIPLESAEEFGRLLGAWTAVTQAAVADRTALEAENQAWLRGEL